MTTTATDDLFVNWTAPTDSDAFGWYVSVWHEGQRKVIPLRPFASRHDAEQAKRCLLEAGLGIAESLQDAGWKRVAEVMYSDLAW